MEDDPPLRHAAINIFRGSPAQRNYSTPPSDHNSLDFFSSCCFRSNSSTDRRRRGSHPKFHSAFSSPALPLGADSLCITDIRHSALRRNLALVVRSCLQSYVRFPLWFAFLLLAIFLTLFATVVVVISHDQDTLYHVINTHEHSWNADDLNAHFMSDYKSCTMDSCFNWTRCIERGPADSSMGETGDPSSVSGGYRYRWQLREKLKVYIYGDSEGLERLIALLSSWRAITALHRDSFTQRVIEPLMNISARNSDEDQRPDERFGFIEVTKDPSEACLFVPFVSCGVNECDFWEGTILSRLQRLPYWDGGMNHIVYDIGDDRNQLYESEKAIRLRSAFSYQYYRPGFDVAIPLPFYHNFRNEASLIPPNDRKYLLTFQGYDTDRSGLRSGLAKQLHNGEDVIIVIKNDTLNDKSGEGYKDLLLNSTFALVPRGLGLHSHRLFECLSAGSIPVIIADDLVLPYPEFIDWRAASIRIPENRTEMLLPYLRSLPPSVVLKMHRNALALYDAYFQDQSQMILYALKVIWKRMHDYYAISESFELSA